MSLETVDQSQFMATKQLGVAGTTRRMVPFFRAIRVPSLCLQPLLMLHPCRTRVRESILVVGDARCNPLDFCRIWPMPISPAPSTPSSTATPSKHPITLYLFVSRVSLLIHACIDTQHSLLENSWVSDAPTASIVQRRARLAASERSL
jgi:hypothetical protein